MRGFKSWFIEKVWKHIRRAALIAWLLALFVTDKLIDAISDYLGIIVREPELFAGVALFLMGILSFESDRYCDGNTVDHLSCTRPATYYYFDWLDVTLVILGVFFLLFWYLKWKEVGNSSRKS